MSIDILFALANLLTVMAVTVNKMVNQALQSKEV